MMPNMAGVANSKWRVFLSSTFRELEQERDAVLQALQGEPDERFEVVDLRNPDAQALNAEELCKREVERADLLVLILGEQLGSRVSGKALSYTELEFDVAQALGMEVLAFRVQPPEEGEAAAGGGDPAPAQAVKMLPPLRKEREQWDRTRQERFCERVQSVTTPNRPMHRLSRDELAAIVARDLARWADESARPRNLPGNQGGRFVDREQEYRRLRERVLAGRATIVWGPSGRGKSTLIGSLGEDPEVRRRYGSVRAVEVAVDVISAPRGALAARSPGSDLSSPKDGGGGLQVVSVGSLWGRHDAGRTHDDVLRELGMYVQARFRTAPGSGDKRAQAIVFDVVERSFAAKIAEAMDIHPIEGMIAIGRFDVPSVLAYLRDRGALVPDCPVCTRYGDRLARALDGNPQVLRIYSTGLENLTERERHRELGKVDRWLGTLDPSDIAFAAVRERIDASSDDERMVLETASQLLPSPFEFPSTVLGGALGESADAPGAYDSERLERALESLSKRELIELDESPDTSEGDEERPYICRIHSLVAGYVQRVMDVEGQLDARRLTENAWREFDRQLNALFEDTSYETWYKLEQPEWQNRVLQWVHLMTDIEPMDSAVGLVRLYLKALWWWGWYIPFDLCDKLVDLGTRVAARSDPDRPGAGQLRRVAKGIETLHAHYPRNGLPFYDDPRAISGDWETTRQAIEAIVDAITLNSEVRSVQAAPVALRDQREEAQAEIDMYVKIFTADCIRGLAAARLDDDQLEDLAASYADAKKRAEELDDDWNLAWTMYMWADGIASWTEHRELRSVDELSRQGRRADTLLRESEQYVEGCRSESVDDLDYELAANVERVRGDIAWWEDRREHAIAHYARAVHYAHAFQVWPVSGPDPYTAAFYREQCHRLAIRISGLDRADGRDEARSAADQVAAFRRKDGEEREELAKALKEHLREPNQLAAVIGDHNPMLRDHGGEFKDDYRLDAVRRIREVEKRHPELVTVPSEADEGLE
jgi:Domain of unknown function (DUF4062)